MRIQDTEVYACPECDGVHWYCVAEGKDIPVCVVCGWFPDGEKPRALAKATRK